MALVTWQEGGEQDEELGINLNAKPPKRPKPAPLDVLVDALAKAKCRSIEPTKEDAVAAINFRREGFHKPYVVKSSKSAKQLLGLEAPPLTLDKIVEHLGEDHSINTVKVRTQSEGPKLTASEFREYWNSQESR